MRLALIRRPTPALWLLALFARLAALWAGATTIPGGWFEPWNPNMMDLDVYRRTGEFLLQGTDIYAKGAYLPWIYPPFAALFTADGWIDPELVHGHQGKGFGVRVIAANAQDERAIAIENNSFANLGHDIDRKVEG